MIRAWIITQWVQDIDANGFAHNDPALFKGDFAMSLGESWMDVTDHPSENIPPSPNYLIVEVNVEQTTLDAIKASSKYGNAAVLWEGDPANSPVVTEPQYTALCQWLANKFNATVPAVQTLLGSGSGGRTRLQIALQINDYLKSRPHA